MLAQAAARLARPGMRVGLVTNDQAAGLVDSALLKDGGSVVEEVADGCFCCRFQDLLAAVERLEESRRSTWSSPSRSAVAPIFPPRCSNPSKKSTPTQYHLAPFSVLVDPARLREAIEKPDSSGFPAQVLYFP